MFLAWLGLISIIFYPMHLQEALSAGRAFAWAIKATENDPLDPVYSDKGHQIEWAIK